jgi:uncharacterized protein
MNMTQNTYTLITGGSNGIGKALAEECARRGMNLLLVALPDEALEITAVNIRTSCGVAVHTLGIDLTLQQGPLDVFEWCTRNDYHVNFLINNAGMAGTAVFENSPPEYTDLRILLNIRALALLCRYFIPLLREHPASCILNVGSLSGYYSIPYKSIYSASKAFVVSFSKSLREELKRTSIGVSVLCPNGVETNEGTLSRIDSHGFWGRLTKTDKDKLAVFTLDRVMRGKRVIIPGRINRLMLLLTKLIPDNFQTRLLEREFNKEVHVS